MRVEQSEVVDDDRHGQVERENAEQRAHRPDQHADVRARTQVAVADRRHRDDRPPQSDRNGREAGAVRRTGGAGPLQPLCVVDERREDDESDDEEEHEQAELVGARTERLDEDLESTSAHLPPLDTPAYS